MRSRLLLIGLCTFSASASAMQPVTLAGLLASEIARPLLEQGPAVAAPRAGQDVALQEAGILDQSPYEWTGVQNCNGAWKMARTTTNGTWASSAEYAWGSRPRVDRQLGKATRRCRSALRRSPARIVRAACCALWLVWLGAEHASTLAQHNLQATQASLEAVDKRLRAGDAYRLEN